ncbi:hypothetical protein PaeBR_09785 [Paenibacillus sp. BR2-3]|uniref:hypothetical protein n=1 Tax=Paenibacillus sp. BR2-3 TaxID=3048494 RepID=UPI0039776C10
MPTKLLWRVLLGLIIIMTAGGCSSIFGADNGEDHEASGLNGPVLSLLVDGSERTDSRDKQLSGTYRKGMTVKELLKASGVVVFAEDGKSILSVSDVSLDPGIDWELRVNGKTITGTDWDNSLDKDSHLVITPKLRSGEASLQSVILVVNGGSERAELSHSYIIPFAEDLTVRSVLKSCGMVRLSEDNKAVLSVKDYIPLTSELWMLKVNEKQLLDSGMDMKLRPQDEVELSLVLR